MSNIEAMAERLAADRELQAQFEQDPLGAVEFELGAEARAELETEFATIVDLLNRILQDEQFASDLKDAITADSAAALRTHGLSGPSAAAALEFLGAPDNVKAEIGASPEFIPFAIGALRATQVAIKVAPRVHAGVKAVAPYIGIGGAIKGLFG